MMRDDELFEGVSIAVRASTRLDGNAARLEACWTASNCREMLDRLEQFGTSTGRTALKFNGDEDRIAADIKIMCERIAWRRIMDATPAEGTA
ncbi:hypothetical protein [Ensifer canadensis]|uniref:hypothetical protein n=1 Tax=Ensifer canadensis TaxID=555315 RepID=UPI0035E3CAE9